MAAMEFGKIGRQRRSQEFPKPAGPRVDEERGTDFNDNTAEVGERRYFHGGTEHISNGPFYSSLRAPIAPCFKAMISRTTGSPACDASNG